MHHTSQRLIVGCALLLGAALQAAPTVSRLTPPSIRFDTGESGAPYIARFLPGQRFDLQATVKPDAGQTIVSAEFYIDGKKVPGNVTLLATSIASPANTVSPTLRAHSVTAPGVHTLSVRALQSDGKIAEGVGEFEVVGITQQGRRAKNVIVMIGDGMGAAHRSAARIAYRNVLLGKSLDGLEMDQMEATAMVKTASLNSIITDSSPGAACYSSGNKANNNQQGVFPDDTASAFDNPRVELIGEYLARTQGKALGIVTTSDVFDATPGAFGTHTANRGAGSGICDQFLDEATAKSNLRVLMGGGRKWFLPASTPGSARTAGSDYTHAADLSTAWNVKSGAIDPERDLLTDFKNAGFAYASDKSSLEAVAPATDRLLGLFALSNMNVAFDKLNGRRGTSTVVNDYGFPNQPLLEEMTSKALQVLNRNKNGFVLMVEGASIDKQAHNMDTERWILDTIEFDKAIGVARKFVAANPDTLLFVTADHECAGVGIIGASTLSNADLVARSTQGGGVTSLRNGVVGTYENARFPLYSLADDGYPVTLDIDRKMLVGYAANADRYEDWVSNALPLQDSQQPFYKVAPLNTYPAGPHLRDTAGGFLVTGQVEGTSAVHTGSDIPLTATGRGASLFRGVVDNTDVFFIAMQAVLGGSK